MYMLCIGLVLGVALSATVVAVISRVLMAREAAMMPDPDELDKTLIAVSRSPLVVEILQDVLKDVPGATQRLCDSYFDWDK